MFFVFVGSNLHFYCFQINNGINKQEKNLIKERSKGQDESYVILKFTGNGHVKNKEC